MKKTPLLILIGLLVVTVPIAALMLANTPQRFTPVNDLLGKKLVTGLEVDKLEEIRIANGESEVTLKKTDSGWVVADRADYPIDNFDEVERLVGSVLRLKAGIEIRAEERHLAEMGLLTPAQKEEADAYLEKREKEGVKNPTSPIGTRITMKGPGDTVYVDLVLGESFGGNPGEALRGILLRSLKGQEGVWKALGRLNRRTGEATPNAGSDVRRGQFTEPKAWLSYKFIEVEKIKSISLSAPNDKEFKGWTVSRETEEGAFTMEGLTDEEELDSTSATNFKTLFSKLRFEDVLSDAEAKEKEDTPNARVAVFTTFDGFTYTFTITPMKAPEKEGDEDDSTPPPSTNYIGTVKVEGDFKKTRDKKEGETEEQSKGEDQAFALRLENKELKLKREKAYEGRPFEFAMFTMTNLLKSRDEMAKAKAPASPEPEGRPGTNPAPGTPGKIQAVTPPIPIPPAPAPPIGGDEE